MRPKQFQRLLCTVFLGTGLIFGSSGCGLLQLPFALIGNVLSLVQIPLNMALSLIGPATRAAPAALLFVQHWEGDAPADAQALCGQPFQVPVVVSAPKVSETGQAMDLIILRGNKKRAEQCLAVLAQGARVISVHHDATGAEVQSKARDAKKFFLLTV